RRAAAAEDRGRHGRAATPGHRPRARLQAAAMNRLGLRARVTATVAIGALLLSTAIAALSYQVIRSSMLFERERTAERTFFNNQATVRDRIGDPSTYGEALKFFEGRIPVLYDS